MLLGQAELYIWCNYWNGDQTEQQVAHTNHVWTNVQVQSLTNDPKYESVLYKIIDGLLFSCLHLDFGEYWVIQLSLKVIRRQQ